MYGRRSYQFRTCAHSEQTQACKPSPLDAGRQPQHTCPHIRPAYLLHGCRYLACGSERYGCLIGRVPPRSKAAEATSPPLLVVGQSIARSSCVPLRVFQLSLAPASFASSAGRGRMMPKAPSAASRAASLPSGGTARWLEEASAATSSIGAFQVFCDCPPQKCFVTVPRTSNDSFEHVMTELWN
jgi:hypothetical protein